MQRNMLQNRVDPFGRCIITSARGLWMGNRGVIHQGREIVRVFKHKAWITCVLEFKARKRVVMTPNRWTELFFMDEATAFAAGHRPCFECRKEDAKRLKNFWINGNTAHPFNSKTSIKLIDEIIHGERIDGDGKKVTYQSDPFDLPDGTFVSLNNNPYLLFKDRLHLWTPFGYHQHMAIPPDSPLTILTPRSVVNAFRAGYVPQVNL